MGGWGEQPRLQQPVPKPVLKHDFLGTFCFEGWVNKGCFPPCTKESIRVIRESP